MFTWRRVLSAFAWGFLTLLVSSRNSFSDPQDIFGRHYVRDGSRVYITDSKGEKWDIAAGVILVRFVPKVSAEEIAQFERSAGVWPTPRLTTNAAGYREFKYATSRDPIAVLTAVAADPLVRDVCLDTQIKFFGDPYYEHQWNLQIMRMEKAWEVTRADPSITIAVIDDGTDYGHEDLSAVKWLNPNDALGDFADNDSDSVWYGSPLVDDFTGWDFWSNDNKPLPDPGNAHGTEVAGVAMAVCDNNLGVAGASGSTGANGARLMSIRVQTQAGYAVANAIEYAWRKGATVINMSFGILNETAAAVPAQLDSAEAHGVIVVAAAGNFGEFSYPTSHIYFPALYPSVIGVGASDENDLRWPYSCTGPELDLLAPAGGPIPNSFTEMWTTDNYPPAPGGDNPQNCSGGCPAENDKYYSRFGWTSGASPEVASIAALLKSHMPGLTPAQVRERLSESAIDLGEVGPDSLHGYGRVDAYRALTEWGTISGNVTWRPEDTADSTRYISGDLTIASGATLTIMPGTIVRIASEDDLRAGPDTLRVEINVEGTLIADGTSANPVVFESWHPLGTDDWAGIYFKSQSGGGTFDHCDISGAETAIESYVPLTLTNSAIHDCSYAAVMVQDGSSLVQNCTLTNPGLYGIHLAADTMIVRGTTVDGATATALHVESSAAATVRASQFLNSDKGLYHSGYSRFVDIDSSCMFNGNVIGVHFYQTLTASNLKRSTINENTSTGVVCDAADGLILANSIESNNTAINCANEATPTVSENMIRSNANGVIVALDANPDLGYYPSGGNNTFAYNSSKHVNNYTANLVVAQNNCWNVSIDDCGPKAGKIAGDVNTEYPICCDVSASSLVFAAQAPKAEHRVVTGISSIVPNPFNPQTTIHYGLAASGEVDIRVFDVAGRLVRDLVKGRQVHGVHQVVWDGTDRHASSVATGVYFVRMIVGHETFTRKMVLLK